MKALEMKIQVDNMHVVYADGVAVPGGTGNNWQNTYTINFEANTKCEQITNITLKRETKYPWKSKLQYKFN